MEGVALSVFHEIYRGRRVLVTGHTGFKGSWLSLWLTELGAEVTGVSLDPRTDPNHWDLLRLPASDRRHDIGDAAGVLSIVQDARPEIVFHLAAQPLVRRSYRQPIETWSVNVMGTAHVLEACRLSDTVKAIVVATTDKVYANQEWPWGYRENDILGGRDPYSASKAACEILVESYRRAFFSDDRKPALASTRAGNVIGGGDWAEDRLIPDVITSLTQRKQLVIRSPRATRPWQHVLDCLSGYLVLGGRLLHGAREGAQSWNFGPGIESNRTVTEILQLFQASWPALQWEQALESGPHETNLLFLDCSKARTQLGWRPVWNVETAVQLTATWYRRFQEMRTALSLEHLRQYIDDARSAGLPWTLS